MEFCGGHTHAIARYGITEWLPPAVRMIHGPGCPVCVTPLELIDQAVEIAARDGLTRIHGFDECREVPPAWEGGAHLLG